jgi:hypothetical protein
MGRMQTVSKDESSYVKLALTWFVHLPLVSKLILFFGCLLLLSGMFGLQPPRPVFSVRLMCLGLAWDYFFRFQLAGIHKEEYHDAPARRTPWVDWSRLVGGSFFLFLAAAPTHYWMWIYNHLSN